MTPLADSLLALILALVLNLFIVSRIRRGWPPEEARFLSRLYWWAVMLRGIVALYLNMAAADQSFAAAFWGDSATYDWSGYMISLGWHGDAMASVNLRQHVSGFGFHYFVAFIYYIFGRNILLVQLINGAIGGLSAVVIYAIARDLFGEGTARWAGRFMAFFPQTVFWSCAMYKDPAILLCIAVSMYAVLRLRQRFGMGQVFLFVGTVVALMTLRFYVAYMIIFATVGTFIFSQRRGPLGSVGGQVVLGLALLAGLGLGVRRETVSLQASYLTLDRLEITRKDQIVQGASGYGGDIDVSTPGGVAAAIPKGFVYLMFAPFPWSISGVRQLLTLPETLVWYALMPALLRGTLHAIRYRFRDMLPILAFAAVLTLAYSVFQTNVGTAYRQRTQVTMFFFILMGAGIELKRRKLEPEGPYQTEAHPS